MVVNLCNFIAVLNHSLLTGQRLFTTQNTIVHRDFVLFLKASGYILGFHCANNCLYVYPNHLCIGFSRVTAVSTPSRSVFYGLHRLKRDLKSGYNYLLYFNGVFRDSHACLLENTGGYVVARIFLLVFINDFCLCS